MIETLLHWIAAHGYGVIFTMFALGIVGLPLPDEWLLAYLGFLIYKGKLLPAPTVAAAFFGSVCGMTINYVLGRTFGIYLVHKFGKWVRLDEQKISRVHDWYEQRGRWGLLFGYFLPGVRHLTAFVAGTSKMKFSHFALFAFSGAFLWSSAFIRLGYFMEDAWSRESDRISHILGLGSVASIGILALYLYLQKRRRNAG
jgi:membrane protein DedA with SNARE-associated domain